MAISGLSKGAIAGEPAVRQVAAVVADRLAELGRTGLAGDLHVAGGAEVGAAIGDGLAHALAHDGDVARVDVEVAPDVGRHRGDRLAVAVAQLLDDVRDQDLATVGDGGGDDGHLHRRRGDVALADAHVVGVTDRPGLAERLLLPLRVRHDAFGLAGDVDAGALAEAEALGPVGQLVVAQALEDTACRSACSRRPGSRSRRRTTWRRRGRSSSCRGRCASRGRCSSMLRVELVRRPWMEPRLVICVLAVATPSCRAARPVIS